MPRLAGTTSTAATLRYHTTAAQPFPTDDHRVLTDFAGALVQNRLIGSPVCAVLRVTSRYGLVVAGHRSGELHDVLAHALSGLAIQLQGARKLADAEGASDGLRAAIGRSAELAKEGLADARQAVGALRGDGVPTISRLGRVP